MALTKDRIGGLLFLALCIAYGFSAYQIPFYPGDEYEPFTSRTLPIILAVIGTGLSLALIFAKSEDQDDGPILPNFDWRTGGLMMLYMVGYGIILEWFGYTISTAIFLIAGFHLLGERRWTVLLGVSIPFVIGFWALLVYGLDIYLAPGELFQGE